MKSIFSSQPDVNDPDKTNEKPLNIPELVFPQMDNFGVDEADEDFLDPFLDPLPLKKTKATKIEVNSKSNNFNPFLGDSKNNISNPF